MDYNHFREVASTVISAVLFFCVPIAQEYREEETKLNNINNKEKQQNKN